MESISWAFEKYVNAACDHDYYQVKFETEMTACCFEA
jgi:hypothetical protein